MLHNEARKLILEGYDAYSFGGSRAVDATPLSKPKNTTILSSIQLNGTLHYISNRLAVSLKLRFSFLIVSITLIFNSPLYVLFGIPFGI